jgi:MFS transporter, ACS family, tartrate transporter
MAVILVGIPLASALGAPLSGFILDHVHGFGLSSSRWLLILEKLPAVTYAYLAKMLLPNGPDEAGFFSGEEKAWVTAQLEREEQQKTALRSLSVVRTSFVEEYGIWFVLVLLGALEVTASLSGCC